MADTDFNPEEFDDDAAIAQEMRHAASQICYSVIKCRHCGIEYGSCCEVQFNLNGGSMLPQPKTQVSSGAPANTSAGAGPRKQGYDYVTVDMLKGRGKQRCLLLGVEETPEPKPGQRKFSDVRVKFQMGGRILLMGLSVEGQNPNYQLLCDALGLEPMDWVNREFWLFATDPNFEGKQYPRLEVIPLTDNEPMPSEATEPSVSAADEQKAEVVAPVQAARRAQPRR